MAPVYVHSVVGARLFKAETACWPAIMPQEFLNNHLLIQKLMACFIEFIERSRQLDVPG